MRRNSRLRIRRGNSFFVYIELSNESDYVWCSFGDHPVYLSYHWRSITGETILNDGLRSPLTGQKLLPQDSAPQKMLVSAPSDPGTYELVITLVQEYVRWFEDIGFTSTSVAVDIV